MMNIYILYCEYNYGNVEWTTVKINVAIKRIDELQEQVKPISEGCFEKLDILRTIQAIMKMKMEEEKR